MLFDLGGKRKRFIQVVYALLALLLGLGLVLFGIGGNFGGGIVDGLGLGGDGSSSSSYDQQIDNANEALTADPEDEKALLKLARYQFLAAQDGLETDEQGRRTLTPEALEGLQESTAAWERYLDTKPKQPDDNVATLMLQAYSTSAGTDAGSLETDVEGAAEAAGIIAEARPSLGAFADLATYAYLAGDEKTAQEAEKNALAEATDATTRKQLEAQFEQAQKQRELVVKAIKENAPDESALENPLGGLGGSSSAVPGTTP